MGRLISSSIPRYVRAGRTFYYPGGWFGRLIHPGRQRCRGEQKGLGVVNVSKAGDVIGEMGVLANQARAANCKALAETTTLHIDPTDFCDLLEHSSLLSVSVIRVLVSKLLNYSNAHYAIED